MTGALLRDCQTWALINLLVGRRDRFGDDVGGVAGSLKLLSWIAPRWATWRTHRPKIPSRISTGNRMAADDLLRQTSLPAVNARGSHEEWRRGAHLRRSRRIGLQLCRLRPLHNVRVHSEGLSLKQVMVVEFYFTPSSRYSYLASTQLEGISERTGCAFAWKPLNNHAILDRFGANPFQSETPGSGQYAWSYRERDARQWADYYNVPFVEPVNFRKDPPWLERGCFAAEACGTLVPFCRHLFHAIFVEGRALEENDLPGIAANAGIHAGEFKDAYASQHVAERQESVLEEAVSKGVFGVPTFIGADAFFWGNDRLVLLEHALGRGQATHAKPTAATDNRTDG